MAMDDSLLLDEYSQQKISLLVLQRVYAYLLLTLWYNVESTESYNTGQTLIIAKSEVVQTMLQNKKVNLSERINISI